jgi:2,3-bisphosphoglycerate-dependent phosphoglycerate mutase
VTIEAALAEHRSDEKYEVVQARAVQFLASVEHGPQHTLGLVTHGSPVRALLGQLSQGKLDLAKYNFAGGNPAPTAGIWRAERVDSGWQLDLVFEPQALKT